MSDGKNPYEPPESEVAPPPEEARPLQLLPESRSLPVGRGSGWIADSWPLVKANLRVWVLMIVLLFGIQVVFGMAMPAPGEDNGLYIPMIFVFTLIWAVIDGGIILGVRATDAGEALRFEHLFAGFREKLMPLLGLGVVSFGISQLTDIFVISFVGIDLAGLQAGEVSLTQMFAAVTFPQIAMLVVLYLIVMMLFWFAAHLVVLNDVPVLQSLVMSLKGCLRNPLPLILYAFLMFLLVILGAIPLMLGLLVVMPLLFTSVYLSYREIFLV